MKYLTIICLCALALACNTSKQAPASSPSTDTEAREAPRNYTFMGNEPFWSVQVKEGAITFRTPEEGPVSYPYYAPKEAGGRKVLESKSGNSHIKITFRKEACTDNMSGESFPYTAEVARDGKIYHGCGK